MDLTEKITVLQQADSLLLFYAKKPKIYCLWQVLI